LGSASSGPGILAGVLAYAMAACIGKLIGIERARSKLPIEIKALSEALDPSQRPVFR